MVIALHEPPKWNNLWPIVGLYDGWNDKKSQSTEWNYHNPTGWPDFENNISWEKSASVHIQEWHYQESAQQQHHVKSNEWTNCVTKKPRYLHTEVIYPKVIKKNIEWDSNIRKPSYNEWSRDLSHGEVW